ncbi:sulfotransferase [Gammaproteobacteria bacterium]|nr:sulfotransferase [Gammaproteobacteria bacterium]
MSELGNAQMGFNNAVSLYKDNSLNDALEQLIEILKVEPNHKESLNLIIHIYIKINESDLALKYINNCINNNHDLEKNLEIKYKLMLYKGDLNKGLYTLKYLHDVNPTINSVRELSNLYIDLEEFEKSENVIQDFFEENQSYSELYKGIRHVKAGRNKLAEVAYKNVLKKDNNNVDALRLLGLLAFRQRNYDIAETLFIRAIRLNPNFILLWENLAKCYRLQNKLDHAKKAFENLLKLDPNNDEALGALGTIYIRLSNFKEGIQIYNNIINRNANRPRVHLSLGHAYKTVGHRKESEQSYLNAINYFPLCGEAYWSLANLKTYQFSENQIIEMERALKDEINDQEKTQMLFALGKAYESKKDFAKSFYFYHEGNWLHRKTLDYNAQENSESIDQIIDFFNKNNTKLNYSGFRSPDPIFILGLPRAGSTLIEQILSSHSLIEGTQEHHNIMSIGRKIRELNNSKSYVDNLLNLTSNEISDYGKKYINDTKWSRKENSQFFIDKMPNNFPYIGLIKMILPNAKIIDARRNPLDGCFSCFKQYFAKGQHFTYDLDDIARYYKDYQKIMNFWNQLYPDSIHTIKYENVINNSEEEVRSLLTFLNLDFEESCMKFYESSRPVKTASSEQVRQPIYNSGVNYWKNYQSDLEVLINHFPNYAK